METVLELLKNLGIEYELQEHPAVFTVDEERAHAATVELSRDDFKKFLDHCGNPLKFVTL